MIESKIILDSQGPYSRLITVEVKFHRFILSQVNTHRAFSRNSGSNRAVPIQKTIDRILDEIAYPVRFGTNQPGMQSGPPLEGDDLSSAINIWTRAAHAAIGFAEELVELNVHKEVVNRLLEPFMWHTAIISATDWENFFTLRADDEAQPEIQQLAISIRDVIDASTPQELHEGQWHLPYISQDEYKDTSKLTLDDLKKISVARCARVSYLNHDKKVEYEKDFALYNSLKTSGHWSPFEHVAKPEHPFDSLGNFRGWQQLRHSVRDVV